MKTVILYETAGAPLEKIMAAFPRHKVVLDAFAARGEIIGIGAFDGGGHGSMGIFRNRAAAEAFVAQDPFVQEGLVAKVRIHDWSDEMLK